jgi:hypothetical protein
MAEHKGKMEIEQISDDQARAQLKETYADPDAAGRFFDELIATREKALDGFTQELNGDERLAERFARNPVEFLHERKLLGPLDQITLEGLRNPFIDFPWPWPICRIRCSLECRTETHWICIGFWPLRICWPVFHIHCRWHCHIVCD